MDNTIWLLVYWLLMYYQGYICVDEVVVIQLLRDVVVVVVVRSMVGYITGLLLLLELATSCAG